MRDRAIDNLRSQISDLKLEGWWAGARKLAGPTLLTLCAALALADEPKKGPLDALRVEYQADAAKYLFHHDAEKRHPLLLVEKPIMKWANDDDWSGDVFVWTHAGRPEVIGCILSGPATKGRHVFHEFHVLAEKPIAAATMHTHRLWSPKEGLASTPVPGAPAPSKNAVGRMAQMRQISRDFTAHMEADGTWELRLLPQPLLRFGVEKGPVIDGALFTFVWTKGTDPEVVLLLEARETEEGPAWHYAPVRFSNRELWLSHKEKEVWRVASHREPEAELTQLPYTTAYSRSLSAAAAAPEGEGRP